MEPALIAVGVIALVGWVIIRLIAGPEEAPFLAPVFQSSPTPRGPDIPRGYRLETHKLGWKLTSGPEIGCRIRAETSRGPKIAESGWIRVEIDEPRPSDILARLFSGELSDWQWKGTAWECTLGRVTDLAIANEKVEGALLMDALSRLSEAMTLHRRMDLAQRLSAEHAAFLEHVDLDDTAALVSLGPVLAVDIASADAALANHLATQVASPILWLVLLENPRTAASAYTALWSRWAGTPHEEAAIRRALETPQNLDEPSLQALFNLLERRRDPRLPPLLTTLVSDFSYSLRALVVSCLERQGDATALPALDALLEHAGPESGPSIERAQTAIRFRQQAALSHTAGGLSVAQDGGSLALADNAHTVTQETP